MRLDEFLKEMIEAKASDVFIVAGLPIAYRVGGRQQRIDGPALMPQDTEAMVRAIYEVAGRSVERFLVLDNHDEDFSFALPGIGRFRANVFRQRGSLSAVIRVIPFGLPDPKDFNIPDYRCVLSLRDPADKKKYHDDDAMWNHAEQALREVLTELGIHFTEEIGEAAFYGPKLDVNVKPAVGAEYTLSTCQLDFCLPAKFHLTYVDKDGSEKTPVVLHRAILGSLDRFMAYLIEETKGRFPTWLAPTQVKVLPVSEKTLDYAKDVTAKLQAAGVRVVLDESNEKIGYKIRQAQQVDRVPYMLVLGAKEVESNNISVRDRKGETTTMDLDAFINQVVDEIKTRKNNG